MFVSNGNSDWWNAVEKGMFDGAKEFGAQVEMRRNNAGDTTGQMALLEDVLSLPDVQGVAISVLEADSPGIADKMRELQKAGKVVIAIDSDGQKDARRAYIGTINREGRRGGGESRQGVAAAGRKDGGIRGNGCGCERTRAARRVFCRRRGIVSRITRAEMPWKSWRTAPTRVKPRSTFRRPSASIPTRGCSWASGLTTRLESPSEVAKFPDLRKKLTVVTFDLDEQAVEHVIRGDIDATVCQNPYQMGYLGVRLLKAYIEKDKKTIDEMLPGGTDSIDTGVRVIVPTKESPVKGDNVIDIKEMKAWLDSKGLKST